MDSKSCCTLGQSTGKLAFGLMAMLWAATVEGRLLATTVALFNASSPLIYDSADVCMHA